MIVPYSLHNLKREREDFMKNYTPENCPCICPQSEACMCDGDCFTCDFHRTGHISPLDVPIGEDGEGTLLDTIPADAPSIEDHIADRDLIDRLFARLRALDPEADTIISLWCKDDAISDCAIAEALGRPQHMFAVQMKHYRSELRRIRGF